MPGQSREHDQTKVDSPAGPEAPARPAAPGERPGTGWPAPGRLALGIGAAVTAADNQANILSSAAPGLVHILASPGTSTGVGVILTPSGLVLTSAQVLQGAYRLTVRVVLSGRSYPARLVGTDQSHGLSLLQIAGGPVFRPAALGNSRYLSRGAAVLRVHRPGQAGGGDGQPTGEPVRPGRRDQCGRIGQRSAPHGLCGSDKRSPGRGQEYPGRTFWLSQRIYAQYPHEMSCRGQPEYRELAAVNSGGRTAWWGRLRPGSRGLTVTAPRAQVWGLGLRSGMKCCVSGRCGRSAAHGRP